MKLPVINKAFNDKLMRLIKKTVASFMLLFCSFNLKAQKSIIIQNPIAVERVKEVIEIPWNDIVNAYPKLDTADFKITDVTGKKEFPYQLEYKGEKNIQQLLVLVSIPANRSIRLKLVKGKPAKLQAKTYCRFVPERKDDFAWENDKIAFRMYGKALENFPGEMAYGVDVWVKRTSELVLDKRYKGDKYHIDNGDGLDYYNVGFTLGAGGIAPYCNDSIWYSKNFREWKILDNGPLRSTFQLIYEAWNVCGKKVTVTKTISLDAGSQLNKTAVTFEWNDDKPLPVVIGISKRNEPGEMLLSEKEGLLAYWEPKHGADGTTGIACVFNTPVNRMFVNKQQLLAEATIQKNQPFIYYNGAAWDKAKAITNSHDWFQYVANFKNKLEAPIKVMIK